MVRALELFEAEVAEAHTEDGEPVRGEAGRKVWEMAEAIDKGSEAGNRDRMVHVLRFLGYVAERLDDLERRLDAAPSDMSMGEFLEENDHYTVFREDSPPGSAIHMLADKLDRIEGRGAVQPGDEPPTPPEDRTSSSDVF